MQSVMYIHCCNRAELARCVETTVCHNCAQQTGTIDTCQGANAHWAMPHLSGRRSSLLKRVRFGYGSLTNLFSTTLSIQANSRVLTLTVSAKRKPVHSSYRDVTTKSERVIAHVIGSNLLCGPVCQSQHEVKTITVTICQAFIMNSDERGSQTSQKKRASGC